MASLTETSLWESGIYQWENTDPIEGGANGIDNLPTRQLANRTRWLRDRAVLDNESKTITSLHTFAAGIATGLIHRGTADGADNAALLLAGGGGAAADRGAYLSLYGNEHASEPGNASYTAGAGGRHRFYSSNAGTLRETLQISATGVLRVPAGRAQFGGLALPTTGYGLELSHDGTRGAIESYDRGADQWRTLYINSAGMEISTQGTGTLLLSPGGPVVVGFNYTPTSGAGAGDVVLQNNKNLRAVNPAGTGTVPLVGLNAAGQVTVSQPLYVDTNATVQGSLRLATTVTAGAGAGEIILANSNAVRGVNVTGSGALSMLSLGPSNEARIGGNAATVTVGIVSGVLNPATPNDLVLANGASVRAVVAAGSTNYPLLQRDSANWTGLGWNADYGVPSMKTRLQGVGLNETGMMLFASLGTGTPGLVPVTAGAMDSGGTGFRILRIPNANL